MIAPLHGDGGSNGGASFGKSDMCLITSGFAIWLITSSMLVSDVVNACV
jgi:hypothetical protein